MAGSQSSGHASSGRSGSARTGGEVPSRRTSDRRRAARDRHLVSSWYVWSLLELLRAFYAIAVLALIVFVSLQMEYSLLPDGLPPAADPALVAGAILVFIAVALVAAVFGYFFLWKEGGWIDRAIDRHLQAEHATSEKARDP